MRTIKLVDSLFLVNGLLGRKATVTLPDGSTVVGNYIGMGRTYVVLDVEDVPTTVSMVGASIEISSSRAVRLEDEIYDRTDGWVGRPL